MNVYEIFTKITMQNAASGVLAAILKDVVGLEGGIKNLAKSLESINKTSLAMIGAGGIVGGAAGLEIFKKFTEHGSKLLDQQDQLQRSGLAYNDVLKLQANYFANIAKAIPTSTAAEYLKTVRELRSVTGSQAGAERLAPTALMEDALLSNTLGGNQSGSFYKLMRSAEMKGITTNPAKLAQLTEQAFSYITAFGGKLTPQDFQTFARRGGTAWMNMKPEAFGPAAVAMADLGGSAAGTAMMTLQQLQQGTMVLSRQQAATLEKAGLLDMSKTTKTGFGGSKLQLEPGAILGSLKYMGDLPGWVKNVVYPHMMAAAGGDEALFQNMLGKEAPNRNAAKMIEMFGSKDFLNQIAKDMGLSKLVEPILKAYQDYITRNPKGVTAAFSNQFESMMQAIGAPMMQASIPVLKAVTSMFTAIAEFASTHPDTMGAIGAGFAGLSAALIGVGGAMILAALGPAGWLIGGITGLGAALLLYKDPITKWFVSFRDANWNKIITDALSGMMTALKNFFIHLGDWAAKIPEQIWEAIKGNFEDFMRHLNYEGGGIGGGGVIRTAYESGDVGGGVGGLGGFGMGGKSWSQMNDAEKTSLLAAQRNKEGWYPGSRSFVNNNPGNIRYGEFARSHGATGEAGGFAVFPNEAAGTAAQRALWGTSGYSNLPLSQALSRWGTGALPGFGGGASGVAGGASHIGGLLSLAGESFHFGSGGGRRQHIPFGDYPITPGTIGAWGQAHGAIGLNNNAIWDSTLNRMRRGIEMHPGHGDALFTAGCIAIARGEWPAFKSKVQDLIRLHGQAFLHVGPGGASISPYRQTAPSKESTIHNHIHLDGERIHHSVVKRMVTGLTHPVTAPYHDGSRMWTSPDAGLVGV
jgi:hypothetical protein